ncbi:MAG: hypothetical protein HY516_02435 [Candidatus Aenigmarchaeota archaeon]|nr:hypothetical protein [Candidatus Aenigmarchaeota archaeon]
MPKTISPGDNNAYIFTNATIEEDGLIIGGQYETLIMSGVYVPKGGLVAAKGSSAKMAIFAGSKIPGQVDLRELETARLHAQGIDTPYLVLGNKQTGLVDLSASHVNELTLELLKDYPSLARRRGEPANKPYRMSLILRDAQIDVVSFGYTEGNELVDLDLRGALVRNVLGFVHYISNLYVDEETDIPAEFRSRLEAHLKK